MIILDLDDTLINHSRAQMAAAARFGECYSARIPDYDANGFSNRWKEVAEVHFQSFLEGDISYQEQRRRRLRTILDDDSVSADDADEMFETVLAHYEAAWQLFPDVIDFIKANKSHGLGIISDGSQLHQEKKLKALNVYHHFDFVMTAESTGLCKPDAKLFHKACLLAKVKPEEAYYIGDNFRKDALGASAAGLKGVWLNRNNEPDMNNTAIKGIQAVSCLSDFVYLK